MPLNFPACLKRHAWRPLYVPTPYQLVIQSDARRDATELVTGLPRAFSSLVREDWHVITYKHAEGARSLCHARGFVTMGIYSGDSYRPPNLCAVNR